MMSADNNRGRDIAASIALGGAHIFSMWITYLIVNRAPFLRSPAKIRLLAYAKSRTNVLY